MTKLEELLNDAGICTWKTSYLIQGSTFVDVADPNHPLMRCVTCKDYGEGSECKYYKNPKYLWHRKEAA